MAFISQFVLVETIILYLTNMAECHFVTHVRRSVWDQMVFCNGQIRFDQFECSNGKCVATSQKCDGNNDCGDNSDEQNCGSCLDSQFKCNNGKCVQRIYTCDGDNDCSDYSDELNCVRCTFGHFKCDNGNCIRSTHVCNGDDDCHDDSDERNCPVTSTPTSTVTTTTVESNICNCRHAYDCSFLSQCNGCYDGYYGDMCDNHGSGNCHCLEIWKCILNACSKCESGWKGDRCSYRDYSTCHCQDTSECYENYFPSNDFTPCASGCANGYHGFRCSEFVSNVPSEQKDKTNDGVLLAIIFTSLFSGVFLVIGLPVCIIKAVRRRKLLHARQSANRRIMTSIVSAYTRDPTPSAPQRANPRTTSRSVYTINTTESLAGTRENNTRNHTGQPHQGTTTSQAATQQNRTRTGAADNPSYTDPETESHARLALVQLPSGQLLLLASGLEQAPPEEREATDSMANGLSQAHPNGQIVLPPSYDSLENLPNDNSISPQIYPEEPPPSYDAVLMSSSS